ncbi:hypothetical protein [Kitasatospora sp. NPDC004289]
MSLRKALSTVAVAGILTTGTALLTAPAAQAFSYTYVGVYPTAASCHAAGQAYVDSHRAVNYFCDTTTPTGPARLSVVLY